VVIRGEGFRVEPYQTADGGPAVDATFRARLGGAELSDVRWISQRELRARVPAGLTPGAHRLEIEGPRGAAGALDDAFTVLPDEALRVAFDPFQDGTTAFSFVFGHAGDVFLGPSGDGSGLVRCAPDGTGCASVALSFQRDVTGTSISENACAEELTTLGSQPLCDLGDLASTQCACGPDLEVGRGAMGSFRLGPDGDEWLVAAGRAKGGGLDHVYMTRDVTSPLEMLYADLGVALPSSRLENVVSMAEADGNLHLAMQGQPGVRPLIVVLRALPAVPGLEATAADAFAISFQGTELDETGPGNSPIAQVDVVTGFEGRLFVANRRGVLVSNGPASSLTGAAATSQFAECTPLDPVGWTSTAIARYPSDRDVTPADRGVTGVVPWGGKLYLARNTGAAVPELWVFTPRRDPDNGVFVGCAPDRSDWRLVATNLGRTGNTHLTALFTSSRYLYVGYDADGGVQLWRTGSPDPAGEDDFEGAGGCAALAGGIGGAPCAPVGGPGLGDPSSNTRFFDARAISDGALDHVWVTVGSGDVPVRVYRISER
jgi:hypothetical protein